MDRRTFLACWGAAAMATDARVSQEAKAMWGMIAKITAVPGKRDELIAILRQAAAGMPGCLSYVVAKDARDENVTWVTEVWDTQASHDASLSLPAVKNAIPKSKAVVAGFERVAVTAPVWGEGLKAS